MNSAQVKESILERSVDQDRYFWILHLPLDQYIGYSIFQAMIFLMASLQASHFFLAWLPTFFCSIRLARSTKNDNFRKNRAVFYAAVKIISLYCLRLLRINKVWLLKPLFLTYQPSKTALWQIKDVVLINFWSLVRVEESVAVTY